MAEKEWESIQTYYCAHVDQEVSLDVELTYPIDFLGDQARVGAHRCSNILMCNQFSQSACIFAGTNPDVDPFKDQ